MRPTLPALETPSRSATLDPRQRLEPWPEVIGHLESRGVALVQLQDETAEGLENRLGTQLMALYRDSRCDDSFEALYAFARAAVLRWIRSLVARGARHLDPVELLQDTFVNVFRYPGGFRDEHAGSFRVWVRTIAGNIVRRASSRGAGVSFQELPEGCQEPADGSTGPDFQAMLSEQGLRLRESWMLFLVHYRAAWKQLSDRDRLALELVELEGRSYAEAGEELGVRHSNMKMIVFRARKRIAAHMRVAMAHGGSGPARPDLRQPELRQAELRQAELERPKLGRQAPGGRPRLAG